VLELKQGSFTHADCVGETMRASEGLACHGIVTGGEWWPNDGSDA